jgi:hypothetical protein
MKINLVHFYILAFFMLISPDPFLMLVSGLVLFLTFKLMWRVNEPKHLLVNLVLNWMVVAILLPYGAVFQKPLNELSIYKSDKLVYATWLAVFSQVFYLLGIYLPLRNLVVTQMGKLQLVLSRYDGQKLFSTYIGYSFFTAILTPILLGVSGGQMLMGFVYFKWVFLTFLIIHTSVIPSNTKYVLLFVGFEILLSFSGFWSAFKDYILVAVGAFFTLNRKVTAKAFIATLLTVVVTFFIFVVWSASKGKYRAFLTGGERSQNVVQTNQLNNIAVLWDILSEDFSPENFSTSFERGRDALVYRISYVEYFALALKQVPTFLPHENGQLLQDALEHVLKPRILFPDKKVIYDSDLTSKYTGISFAGRDEGTSFSLGSVPEAYIDFGPVYMFIPIFFFGLLFGWMYKTLLLNGYNIVWGICYSAPIFQYAWMFPVPGTKLLGWSITYFVNFYLINRYLVKYLDTWLLRKEFK